jgi:hypothetical protein
MLRVFIIHGDHRCIVPDALFAMPCSARLVEGRMNEADLAQHHNDMIKGE